MTNPKTTLSYAKAKFPFAHVKLDAQISGVQAVLEKCKTSPDLKLPDPTVDTLSQTTQDLAQTESELTTLKKQVKALLSLRASKELAFRRGCLGFLDHINTLAQGNPTVIRNVGLGLVQHASSNAAQATALMMTKLLGLIITTGVKPGEVHLKWKRVKGAKSYAIEASRLPNEGFTHVGVSTTTRVVLSGQPSATPLWFRVAAVAPTGQGPFSDNVPVVAR